MRKPGQICGFDAFSPVNRKSTSPENALSATLSPPAGTGKIQRIYKPAKDDDGAEFPLATRFAAAAPGMKKPGAPRARHSFTCLISPIKPFGLAAQE
jgi:hypothetical protein